VSSPRNLPHLFLGNPRVYDRRTGVESCYTCKAVIPKEQDGHCRQCVPDPEFPDRTEAERLLVDLVRSSSDGGWMKAVDAAKAYLSRMRDREDTAGGGA